MSRTVSILQTGRLGDLWYTTPLAHWLHQQGHTVEVVYDKCFGNPFSFFPYVEPRPVNLPRYCEKNIRWGHLFNEVVWQLGWLHRLKAEGKKVVWNEIFPFRWLQAHCKGRPYVEYWYHKNPQINFRRATTTLTVSNEKTILVFLESQSISFTKGDAYQRWIDGNLKTLAARTGYKPVVVAYGNQPDHPEYETWRGSLNEYQRLIASCGIVYGISTSAHVLGQLLGKPVVALYNDRQSPVDTIGGETARLSYLEQFNANQLSWMESL
ncbi:MAG: hypothetical protein GXY61_02540 [Lentisphaerae bacterium]|jgi:hypothetical protein|nr:hypothetical protein [Lentisphaerota bacterium]